ncbi:tyrosine-type recombinase/integrase [Spirosoma sp. HMF4905]|uniref:Tyrosine-type recombinase/integrase n=1 Tax=Spirosoma arboris TaxID=2682092 RepID=A0A7K1SFC1_9BACT|nr:site-specific integrase [Spirosoma arboris]MVM32276.1 tyrosine-type recombinase/integrase [Spirosoma arboris]
MRVTLREKPISDGRKSLYLDFYPAILHPETGKPTRREFLGLYVYEKPRLDLERKHNKETRLLGENICAKRQLAIQSGHYGFLNKAISNADFLAWFKGQAELEKQKRSIGSRNNWMSVYQHLDQFSNGKLLASDVTEDFCKQFRQYLTTAKALNASRSGNPTIAYNSAVGYFTIFKAALKRAVEAKVLEFNPGEKVKRLSAKETQREFLTLAELQTLAKTDCDLPDLKRAALFSALTGLRYSDIAKLVWSEVYTDANGHYLRFTQLKTEGVETLPLSDTAHSLLGERSADSEKVFPSLAYSAWQNLKLQQWCIRAGIARTITFHAFRHTFATLQLSLGTDIYTISKMLGHRAISTTQIYAKVVDKAKREAANKIKLEF